MDDKAVKKQDEDKNKPDKDHSENKNANNDELENLKNERDAYKNNYLRALADYQNLDRRVREEKDQIAKTAKINTILDFLPFLDNLEKAEVFIKDPGLKMIKDHFLQTLSDIGITEIDVLGKEFDPHLAEAVELMEGKQDNIAIEVIRKGFMLGDRILRPAQVKVSKKSVT